MKLFESLSRMGRSSNRAPGGSRIVVAHWDRDSVQYLVASPKSYVLLPSHCGRIPRNENDSPFATLAAHLRDAKIQAQKLIVLLSRPELDLLSLNLPWAETVELPALVASEVEQQLGESEVPPVVDFQVVNNAKSSEGNGIQVMAFSLNARELQAIQKLSTEAGFRLAAIGSRHLAPLSILRRQAIPNNSLAISVHLYSGETELAICRGADPILLRSIRLGASDPVRIADQIYMEVQRCLTLLSHEEAELPMSWFVFTSDDTAWNVLRSLEEREGVVAHPVDPYFGWTAEATKDSKESISRIDSAANAGAAWDYLNQTTPINLLNPKRPPKPANPYVRWGLLGTAAACVVGIGTYFLLADVWKLQDEVTKLEVELKDAQKITSKYQEKSDQVAMVEAWLGDQVDWLAELSDLSERLPDGQSASVRRLTAVTNARNGLFNLSVQVADQEFISQLENRIRSAKYNASSKQISQNPIRRSIHGNLKRR